jgi:putative glutamine amidotransferase
MKQLATWIDKDAGQHFEELFQLPEFRLWNARVEEVPWNEVQGLVLTGGADISAGFLKQDVPNPECIRRPNPVRDAWDFSALSRALEKGLPVLAICRGHQVLNVALGGTLVLDIPRHADLKYDNVQELRYAPGAEIQFARVNSSHHQAIDLPGDGLEIEAWHVGDDVVEQVRLRNYPFAIGAQYHPERDRIYSPLFQAFFRELR